MAITQIERMKVRFWGVRGSIPTPGSATVEIGGNTSCVEVRTGDQLIVLDGGTGMRPLGLYLQKERPIEGIILLSHFHWDHIQGVPFFAPFYGPENRFEIFGGKGLRPSLNKALQQQMRPPNFPVRFDQLAASMRLHNLKEGELITRKDIQIKSMSLNHPNPSLAYRIESNGVSLVYATDTEHPIDGVDERLVQFTKSANVLIYDAQFTIEEYEGKDESGRPKKGWGHSTALEGAKVAESAGIEQLILFHHDPSHDDEMVREIERECQLQFGGTRAAYEGLEIVL